MNYMKLRKSDIPKQLLAAFPAYRGRKFKLEIREQVMLSGAYWDGGSRSEYVAVNLDTGKAVPADSIVQNPFKCPTAPRVKLPPRVVIVEHCIFCGKDMGLRFYIRPDDVPAHLETGLDV